MTQEKQWEKFCYSESLSDRVRDFGLRCIKEARHAVLPEKDPSPTQPEKEEEPAPPEEKPRGRANKKNSAP